MATPLPKHSSASGCVRGGRGLVGGIRRRESGVGAPPASRGELSLCKAGFCGRGRSGTCAHVSGAKEMRRRGEEEAHLHGGRQCRGKGLRCSGPQVASKSQREETDGGSYLQGGAHLENPFQGESKPSSGATWAKQFVKERGRGGDGAGQAPGAGTVAPTARVWECRVLAGPGLCPSLPTEGGALLLLEPSCRDGVQLTAARGSRGEFNDKSDTDHQVTAPPACSQRPAQERPYARGPTVGVPGPLQGIRCFYQDGPGCRSRAALDELQGCPLHRGASPRACGAQLSYEARVGAPDLIPTKMLSQPDLAGPDIEDQRAKAKAMALESEGAACPEQRRRAVWGLGLHHPSFRVTTAAHGEINARTLEVSERNGGPCAEGPLQESARFCISDLTGPRMNVTVLGGDRLKRVKGCTFSGLRGHTALALAHAHPRCPHFVNRGISLSKRLRNLLGDHQVCAAAGHKKPAPVLATTSLPPAQEEGLGRHRPPIPPGLCTIAHVTHESVILKRKTCLTHDLLLLTGVNGARLPSQTGTPSRLASSGRPSKCDPLTTASHSYLEPEGNPDALFGTTELTASRTSRNTWPRAHRTGTVTAAWLTGTQSREAVQVTLQAIMFPNHVSLAGGGHRQQPSCALPKGRAFPNLQKEEGPDSTSRSGGLADQPGDGTQNTRWKLTQPETLLPGERLGRVAALAPAVHQTLGTRSKGSGLERGGAGSTGLRSLLPFCYPICSLIRTVSGVGSQPSGGPASKELDHPTQQECRRKPEVCVAPEPPIPLLTPPPRRPTTGNSLQPLVSMVSWAFPKPREIYGGGDVDHPRHP
ncbi:hypothetical protein Cadr_000028698 [Camelus dromedarius]|uniref:Uncharacterized protein n=1 Tax=Camelus dromedarius TaxID=9838 RepID=A0A5N4C8Q2_CAMDR|nr:hypothetical protein Cadr_000028698 [Camelus dromedarius]